MDKTRLVYLLVMFAFAALCGLIAYILSKKKKEDDANARNKPE